jgi:hypothetical protein
MHDNTGTLVASVARAQRTINGLFRRALAQAAPRAHSRVYLLLDPARDPRIHDAITTFGTRYHCIFGDVPPVLARVAPHLVAVGDDTPIVGMFAGEGRNRSWGVMLRSEASIDELATHLYGLVRARLPDGHDVLFRFYDPRVLRAYLPTCTLQELAQVFGPIESFLVEQGDGQWLTYSREHERLATHEPDWSRWIED